MELNNTNKRVWFNHWFSASIHIINMIKKEFPNLYIVGSSDNFYAVYKRACDEFYQEPLVVSESEYVSFALEFVKVHKIDIFIPYFNLKTIVENKDKFEKLGCKLLANVDNKLNKILDDKGLTYEFINTFLPECIPQYGVAKSFNEFKLLYEKIKENNVRVAYKLTIDKGARSFRVIDENIENVSSIYAKPGNKITLDGAYKILKNYDYNVPFLVLPYLDGVEVSCDCIKLKDENIIIPRFKVSKRFSVVKNDEVIKRLCNIILDKLNPEMPVNIQFKYLNNKPYLLEINSRMSGGIQLSALGSGVNLPAIAMHKLLDENYIFSMKEIKETKVVHIETPVIIE